MKEANIMRAIQLKHSHGDVRLFRNNTGQAITMHGEYIRYGLCVGSSDLIGWKTLTITENMVGKKIAQFLAVEVKKNTKTTEGQENFLSAVNEAGGLGKIMYDEGEEI